MGTNRTVNRAEVVITKLHRQTMNGKDSDYSEIPLTCWHQYKVDFEGTIRAADSEDDSEDAILEVDNHFIVVPEHARSGSFKIEEGKKYYIFDTIYTKKKYIWKIDERTISSSDKSINNLNNNTDMAEYPTKEGVLSNFKTKKAYGKNTYIDGEIGGEMMNFKIPNEDVPLLADGIAMKLIQFGGKDWVLSKNWFKDGVKAGGMTNSTPTQNTAPTASNPAPTSTNNTGKDIADATVERIQSLGIVGESTKFDEYRLTLDRSGDLVKAWYYQPQGNPMPLEADKSYKFEFTETKDGLKVKLYRAPKASTATSQGGSSASAVNTYTFGSICKLMGDCIAAGITDNNEIREKVKFARSLSDELESGSL